MLIRNLIAKIAVQKLLHAPIKDFTTCLAEKCVNDILVDSHKKRKYDHIKDLISEDVGITEFCLKKLGFIKAAKAVSVVGMAIACVDAFEEGLKSGVKCEDLTILDSFKKTTNSCFDNIESLTSSASDHTKKLEICDAAIDMTNIVISAMSFSSDVALGTSASVLGKMVGVTMLASVEHAKKEIENSVINKIAMNHNKKYSILESMKANSRINTLVKENKIKPHITPNLPNRTTEIIYDRV